MVMVGEYIHSGYLSRVEFLNASWNPRNTQTQVSKKGELLHVLYSKSRRLLFVRAFAVCATNGFRCTPKLTSSRPTLIYPLTKSAVSNLEAATRELLFSRALSTYSWLPVLVLCITWGAAQTGTRAHQETRSLLRWVLLFRGVAADIAKGSNNSRGDARECRKRPRQFYRDGFSS